MGTAPDGEGHRAGRRRRRGTDGDAAARTPRPARPARSSRAATRRRPATGRRGLSSRGPHRRAARGRPGARRNRPRGDPSARSAALRHRPEWPPAAACPERGARRAAPPAVPDRARAPRIESQAAGRAGDDRTAPAPARHPRAGSPRRPRRDRRRTARARRRRARRRRRRVGTLGAGIPGAKARPSRGTDVPPGRAQARRDRRVGPAAGRRRAEQADDRGRCTTTTAVRCRRQAARRSRRVARTGAWPDPATLLLTALGPGPRLWERGPGHPEALTVRLGTADRTAPDGSGLLPAVPVTAGLREAGALGLAGPRARLAGLARAVVAQLAALHSPDALEIVLISTDRARTLEERTAEWSWLGWLPHLRPGARPGLPSAARLRPRTGHGPHGRTPAPPGGPRAEADGAGPRPLRRRRRSRAPGRRTHSGAARRPSRAAGRRPLARDGGRLRGPYTVVVVDGDPGGAACGRPSRGWRSEGPRAGIHSCASPRRRRRRPRPR